MRVHVHTKFCFLCVLALLVHQCDRCHGDGQGGRPHGDHAHSDMQILEAPYARGATLSPDAKSPKGPTLEEEQRFYIQELFRRYGQKDRLDFQGFQSMLFSLGLGEVKLLDGDHEPLGHDHVSHLDLVDMKDGQGHGHGHGHGHGTHKPGAARRPHAEQVPTSCTTADGKHDGELGQDGEQRSSDGHVQDTHDHDHGHDHGHDHDHAHDKEHTHEQVEVTADQKDHASHDHGAHDHDHAGHDHAGHDHDHAGHDHDHAGHDHAGHDHDHAGRDHAAHDHAAHDHGGHDHAGHDHAGHDHAAHDHAGHDHAAHDHGGHDHDHDHAGHDHDHAGHDHAGHDHDHDHSAQDHASHDHDHATNNHSAHGDDHNHVPESPTVTDIAAPPPPSPGPQAALTSPSPTESRPKTAGKPARSKRGPPPRKAKREATGALGAAPTAPVPVLSGHLGLSHQHEECLNLTQLLAYYGLTPNSLISPSQFTYLCPALLYQIDSRVCIRHHEMEVQQEAMETGSSGWVWLWGFVSITIISLLSLLGVVLVPILKQSCFKFLLTFLVALAVGTLSGDALLHLLPHSQGPHDHGAHGAHGTTEDVDLFTKFDGVWKGLTALAGIYLLFIIEHCIGMFKHYRDHRGRKKANEEGNIGRKLSDHNLNRRSDAEWLHLKPLGEDGDGTAVSCDNGHNDTQLSVLRPPDSPTNKTPLAPTHGERSPAKESGAKHHGHSHGHSRGHGHAHDGNCHSDQEMKDAGIASIAWMVIMGDGMHNFSDGLAIGAAFSANLTGGISTSVAVFCHELPHELGDFAVLLKAGMSVKQAIFYNLLSALMAYLGMAIGTAVGQYTHNLTSWIFAITAGMFLYVALVDMLPEMLHGDSEDHKRCQLGHFVLQNMGMLTGFAIMLLIAIFEDRIIINFGF